MNRSVPLRLLVLGALGCGPTRDPDRGAHEPGAGLGDTGAAPGDTGRPPLPPAPCQPVSGEALAARRVEDAVYACAGDDCTLALPGSEPTRPWARGAPAGDLIVMDAFDTPELLVATGGQVHAVAAPGVTTFVAGDDRVWMVRDEIDIVAVDAQGTVATRCAPPAEMASAQALGVVGGRLLVSGLNPERQPVLAEATDAGWRLLETDVSAWHLRAFADDEVLQLAYGYAEWRDLSTGERILLGGSDDDFSAAAICADGAYWLGGQTGMTLLCWPDHVCAPVPNEAYPFQSQALGCDAQGALWWMFDPGEAHAVQRGTLSRAGDVVYTDAAPGFRTGWEQRGRRWSVVDRG